jgi:hypothetical protein
LLRGERLPAFGDMRGAALVAITVACAHLGCVSNDLVSPRGFGEIKSARAEEGVIYTESGEAIRIDPNSKIRFMRASGLWTPWWSARDLLVNDEGILVQREDGGHDGVRWSDIEAAEIENFSGGKSLVATVAISAAVIGLIAVVSASKGKLGKLPEIGNIFARTTVEVAVRTAAHAPRIDVRSSGSSSSPEAIDPTPAAEDFGPPTANGAAPLFDGVTRRRSIARFGSEIEAGSAFRDGHAFTGAALGSARFLDFFEIGAGVRFVSRGSGADRLIVGRVGMHAELDARKRFAVPLLFDFGGGSGAATSTFRVAIGFRVRVTEALWIGLFPLEPQYVGYVRGTPNGASGWTFPTSIETSFLF